MKMNSIRHSLFLGIAWLTLAVPLIEAESDRVQMRGDVVIKEGEAVDQAVAMMGSIQVNGTVRENAVSLFGDITIGPKGIVQGDAVSVGGHVVRLPGSKVTGKEVALGLPLKGMEKAFFMGAPLVVSMLAIVMGVVLFAYLIGVLALIILVLTLFDKQVAGAQQVLVNHPWKSFFLGLVGFICTLPILLALAITIVGFPLAFVGAVVAVAALVLGTVAVGQWAGTEIAKRFNWTPRPVWAGLLGMTLLFLVCLIPVVGFVIHMAIHMFGFGAVIQSRFRGATA
jgi:hypothetical protein